MIMRARHFTYLISIHAPLTGSDSRCRRYLYLSPHFNPRSPYGERQSTSRNSIVIEPFQSTLPLRGATTTVTSQFTALKFQSTLPLRGATLILKITQFSFKFQSTLPLRGATADCSLLRAFGQFQSTLPLRGATASHLAHGCKQTDFNPRSPYGERQEEANAVVSKLIFQSTLPLRGATYNVSFTQF